MKRYPLFAAALAIAMPVLAWQSSLKLNLDHLASKATEKVDVTLDASLLQFAGGFLANKGDEAKAKKLISNLKGIYVKSFTFAKEGEYSQSDVESVRAQLRSPEWTRIVNVEGKEETAQIYVRRNGNVTGLAIIVAEPKELTVVNIDGNIDPADLRDLGGNFGIPKIDLGNKGKKQD